MKCKWAWIINWEASTAQKLSHAPKPHVVAFLSAYNSQSMVKKILMGIYLASPLLDHAEKFDYAFSRDGKKHLLIEEIACTKCGFNPWLVARKVRNLNVKKTKDGNFEIKWEQQVCTPSSKRGQIYDSSWISCEETIPPREIFKIAA